MAAGGKREGAGRPKKEPTKQIRLRVPESKYDEAFEAARIAVENVLENKQLISNNISAADVTKIWEAAKIYVLQDIGEICKGDASYQDDPPDLLDLILQIQRGE